MKKLILLFLLMIAGVTFAQKDEVYDWTKTTVTLTGSRQQLSANIFQKIIWIDNRGSDSTVYYFKNRSGVADTANGIPIYGRADEKIYNFTDTCIWIKGSTGQTVTIYILKGTGRGIERSSGINQSQMNTALASYYTKTQAHSLFLESADSLNIIRGSDSLSKYATPKYVRDYAGDSSNIGRLNQPESVTGKWGFADSLGVGPARVTRVNSARVKIDKSLDADTLRPNHIIVNGGTAITATAVTTTFVTLAVSGAVNFQSRGQIQTPADGSFLTMNWAGNNFTKWELGAGNYTTGFYHGTVDTDITSVYLRSPNGTLFYITVNDAGVISASTTAP